MKRSNQQVSEEELNNFINQVDKDRDGQLQKDEIYQLYRNIAKARGQHWPWSFPQSLSQPIKLHLFYSFSKNNH